MNTPYEFMNLPGYREITEAEDAAYAKEVEEIVKLLAEQEREKEQETAKLANLLAD